MNGLLYLLILLFHFYRTLNFSFFPITTKRLMDVPPCQVTPFSTRCSVSL